MWRSTLAASSAVLLILALCPVLAQDPPDPGQPGPYIVASVTITTTNPGTGSELVTDIHYPSSNSGVDSSGAPYATLVFAHGTSAPRGGYSGNAERLASWGYIVALPDLPDNNVEVRASDVQYLLSYLESENANGDSLFFQKIDTDRFSLTGHSLGGMSPLMIAARDDRINMAAVSLDPVNPDDNRWDYEEEAPDITAPLGLIGAPAQMCNWYARYNEEYPYIGSTHKAKFIIVGGTHCDFLDAENPLMTWACGLICGAHSEDRLQLIERYTAAWFNYYLNLDTDYYTYLYGDKVNEDIQAGLITRTVQTAPRDVVATGGFGAVLLNWTLYDHPIIAGYNIYRSQQSGGYPSTPYAQVGRVSSYRDTDAVPGQQYFYVLRSRDAAGNEHQPSNEVSAVCGAPAEHSVYLPLILKSE